MTRLGNKRWIISRPFGPAYISTDSSRPEPNNASAMLGISAGFILKPCSRSIARALRASALALVVIAFLSSVVADCSAVGHLLGGCQPSEQGQSGVRYTRACFSRASRALGCENTQDGHLTMVVL